MKNIEVATLPNTMPIKLAKYILALRVLEAVKGKPAYPKALELFNEALNNLDRGGMNKIGIVTSYFMEYEGRADRYRSVLNYIPTLKKYVKAKIKDDPSYTKDEGDVLYSSILLYNNENLYDVIVDKIVALGNKISPKFGGQLSAIASTIENPNNKYTTTKTTVGGNVSAMYDTLKELVKTISGKTGLKVTQEQLNKFKTGTAKQAAVAANYSAIRLKINKKYDSDLSAYIGLQDKPPYAHEVYAHMKKLGYETHRLIAATSKIPLKVSIAAGKLIYLTDDGRVIDGGIPADAMKITFMKTYDRATGGGAYLNYTTPNANGVTRKYTAEHKTKAGEQKFDKADLVAENINKYVTRWNRDLTSKDDTIAMAATACLLIYKTGMRVGSKIESRSISGKKSYGALSLLASQVSITSSKVTLKYAAKKQVQQTNVIEIKDKYDKLLLRNLKEFKTGKGANELLFSYESHTGTIKRLNPSQLTAYLKSMGFTVGIHKIRHVRGTNLAVSLLNSVPWRPKAAKTLAAKQADAEAYIKTKILEPVAKLLGHKNAKGTTQWQTSISNYLNPKPFIQWFKEKGLRIPKWIPKTTATE